MKLTPVPFRYTEVKAMAPTLGQLRFAHLLLSTERRPYRRPVNPLLRRTFDLAVVLTFVFFLFM